MDREWTQWTLEAYISVCKYVIHLIVYSIVSLGQALLWRLNGVSNHLERAKRGECYETSAQLLKLWHQESAKIVIVHQRRHFLTTHVKFVHPEFALQKHVVLMSVSKDEAMFCVPAEDNNLLDTKKYPFIYHATFTQAHYLLIIPTTSFIRLAEKLGDPKQKAIWLSHPGRCGSTAMSQVFNNLPGSVALSENHGLLSLVHYYKLRQRGADNSWRRSTHFRDLFKSTVRLMLKPCLKDSTMILVKHTPMCSVDDSEMLREFFPQIRQVFMYRDVAPQVTSLYKVLKGNDVQPDVTRYVTQFLRSLGINKIPVVCQPMGLLFNASDSEIQPWMFEKKQIKGLSLFGEFTLGWISSCYRFRNLMESADWQKCLKAFKYEDMMRDKETFFKKLMEYLGIDYDKETRESIRRSLTEDSQESTFVSQSISKRKHVKITPDMIAEANGYLQHFGFPLWGESTVLPNTVQI